ncbi:MAG: hypothetical protein RLY31_1055 [Bacteroidota bacterium]|jgi:uncharacterized protein (DUF1800 family)
MENNLHSPTFDIPAAGTVSTQPVATGLAPYNGPFGREQAAHLLRRTLFGASPADIGQAVAAGLDGTIELLFTDSPLPPPPVNHFYGQDPNVPVGQTWVDAPYTAGDPLIPAYRIQSLGGWTIGVLLSAGMNIREKMTLFWHNHFVVSDINDPRFVYRYIQLLREHALGNFRELTKAVTIDPAMLRYLNGRDNTAGAPNENYARELLELFTVGKGPLAGPGDYTHYTEDDVIQMARILTGWRDTGFFSPFAGVSVGSVFLPGRHDSGDKPLSHRFDNIVVTDQGAEEYAQLVDIIFSRPACARFLCRKLYRWFVHYEIDNAIEEGVIEPMAQILTDHDYDVVPALQALLRSEHFFDILQIGPMIKGPVDFVLSAIRPLTNGLAGANLNQWYRHGWNLYRNILPALQQTYYELPSVAGWKAYYQAPGYYRNWISATTLDLRMQFTQTLVGTGITQAGYSLQVEPLELVAQLDDPYDPNGVVDGFAGMLFPQPITASQRNALKELLIPGLPDFEWTVEYTDYLADPGNQNLAAAVEAKLRNLLLAMTSMPEFYLS